MPKFNTVVLDCQQVFTLNFRRFCDRMRSIMAQSKRLTDLETEGNEQAPQPVIPPGTKAKVRVDYETQINPNLQAQDVADYPNDLRALAADEFETPADLPLDPLSEFCATWRLYVGYPMKVTRLADPATRRIPGQAYNRPCFEVEYLSDTPFDPANLTGTLQIINGNSGGVFRLWLTDESGTPIPDARIDRVVIADPPKHFGNSPQQRQPFDPRYDIDPRRPWPPEPTPPAPLPQKSAMEQRIENLQATLFEDAVRRAMNPTPVAAVDGLSAEDRVGLLLLNQGGLLATLMDKVTTLAQSPEAAAVKETIGERAINAGLRIAETNPAIVERISSTLERIVDRVLPNPNAPVTVAANIQPPQSQQTRVSAPHPVQLPPPGPTAPDAPEPDDTDVDDDIMDIVEQLFTLLTDTRPFDVNDPVFVELRETYPLKFAAAIRMIATQPLDQIVTWLKTQSPVYESLLNGPVTSEHYTNRLAELQQFCRTPPAPAPQNNNVQEAPQEEEIRNSQSEIRNG